MGELLIIVAALVLLAAVVLVFSRRVRATEPGEKGPGSHRAESDVDVSQTVTVTPLPNRRNEALVLGSEEAVVALERSGLANRFEEPAGGAVTKLIRGGAGLVGLGSSAKNLNHIRTGKVVEITDESLRELRRFGSVTDSAGKLLPIVRDGKTIKSLVRFKSLGAASPLAVSNAATLAMSVAVSIQLANIEGQLEEIKESLGELKADDDRARLSMAVAANQVLTDVAGNIQRRGEMTASDMNRVDSADLDIRAVQVEAEIKFQELLKNHAAVNNREQRKQRLEKLFDKEHLEYWLAVRVEIEMAQSRQDILRLHWETTNHPDTAEAAIASTRLGIRSRQENLENVRQVLGHLTDPKARTKIDHLRFRDAKKLVEKGETLEVLLGQYPEVFGGPGADRFALTDARSEPIVLELETSPVV